MSFVSCPIRGRSAQRSRTIQDQTALPAPRVICKQWVSQDGRTTSKDSKCIPKTQCRWRSYVSLSPLSTLLLGTISRTLINGSGNRQTGVGNVVMLPFSSGCGQKVACEGKTNPPCNKVMTKHNLAMNPRAACLSPQYRRSVSQNVNAQPPQPAPAS